MQRPQDDLPVGEYEGAYGTPCNNRQRPLLQDTEMRDMRASGIHRHTRVLTQVCTDTLKGNLEQCHIQKSRHARGMYGTIQGQCAWYTDMRVDLGVYRHTRGKRARHNNIHPRCSKTPSQQKHARGGSQSIFFSWIILERRTCTITQSNRDKYFTQKWPPIFLTNLFRQSKLNI